MNISINLYNTSFGSKTPYACQKYGNSIKYSQYKEFDDAGTVPPDDTSEIVLAFDEPEALANYIKKLDDRVMAHKRIGAVYDPEIDASKDVVADIISFIDCKIDFQKLGVNPKNLSKDEMIDYGSEFAFWTTSLEGKPRNGYKKPAYVRSANEYIKLLQDKYPLNTVSEFESLMERLPSDVLKSDKAKQDAIDREYHRAHKDYASLPFTQRIITYEPRRTYTPIYGKLEMLKKQQGKAFDEYRAVQNAEKRRKYQEWLQDRIDDKV